jgi:hypothetical protein
MARMCGARVAEIRNAYNILVGKPEGKRRVGVDENNIRMDPTEIGWEGMDWMHLAQDRGHWRALFEHGDEHSGSIKILL